MKGGLPLLVRWAHYVCTNYFCPALAALLQQTQYKIFFSSLYTISVHLSPSTSKLQPSQIPDWRIKSTPVQGCLTGPPAMKPGVPVRQPYMPELTLSPSHGSMNSANGQAVVPGHLSPNVCLWPASIFKGTVRPDWICICNRDPNKQEVGIIFERSGSEL